MRAPPGTIAFIVLALAACQGRDADRDGASGDVPPPDRSVALVDSVRILEQTWADAIRTRDSVTLERLVAGDFTVSSDGSIDPPLPRATWMTNTLQNLRVDSIRLGPARVVVHGDTAVATLDFFWAGQFMAMPPFRDSTVLTDTWVRGAGGWQVHRRVLAD